MGTRRAPMPASRNARRIMGICVCVIIIVCTINTIIKRITVIRGMATLRSQRSDAGATQYTILPSPQCSHVGQCHAVSRTQSQRTCCSRAQGTRPSHPIGWHAQIASLARLARLSLRCDASPMLPSAGGNGQAVRYCQPLWEVPEGGDGSRLQAVLRFEPGIAHGDTVLVAAPALPPLAW